jgi:GAF domain-containing protein
VNGDAQRWLRQVTQLSGALTSSLEYDATLEQVVRLPIPALADWAMVYVPDDGGALPARLMVAHARPGKEALLRKVWGRAWSVLPDEHPIAESLRKRSPIVVGDCDEEIVRRLVGGLSEHAEVLHRVGLRCMLVLPLVAHGTVVGGLLLAGSQAHRRTYDAASLEPLGELARAYAQAIYNARLFVETRLALRLRDELLMSTRNELLELVATVRERRRERGRVLHWPAAREQAAHGTPRVAELHALTSELEEIAYRLNTAGDPYTSRF